MITGAQVRAARALLGWTARSLAKKAIVPEHSLEWIEGAGKITSKDRDTLDALQATLESGGVEFIGSIGVQLKPDGQKRTVRAKRSKGKRKENPRQDEGKSLGGDTLRRITRRT